MSNILDSVISDLSSREAKGLKEYGVTLDREDYKLKDFLKEAYEEALDTAMYLKAAIKNMEKNGEQDYYTKRICS
jgi:hypothetical protein